MTDLKIHAHEQNVEKYWFLFVEQRGFCVSNSSTVTLPGAAPDCDWTQDSSV